MTRLDISTYAVQLYQSRLGPSWLDEQAAQYNIDRSVMASWYMRPYGSRTFMVFWVPKKMVLEPSADRIYRCWRQRSNDSARLTGCDQSGVL